MNINKQSKGKFAIKIISGKGFYILNIIIIWRLLVLHRLINKQGIPYYLPLTPQHGAVFWLLANTLKTQAVHQGYMRDSSKILVLYSDFSCQGCNRLSKKHFFL